MLAIKILFKVNEKIKYFEEFVISFCVIMIAIIMIVNVIGRVALKHSLSFAEEICTILIVITIFLGVSYCARRGQHILMSALFDAVKPRGKKIFILISSSITCIAMLYLFGLSADYVYGYFESGRSTVALRIPLWIPYLLLPISFFLTALQYFLLFVKNLQEKEVSTCLDPLEVASAAPDAESQQSAIEKDVSEGGEKSW